MHRQQQIEHPEADIELKSLLSEWRAPVASGAFEANVLRAIRCDADSLSQPARWQLFIPSGVGFAAVVTLTVLIAAGALSGVLAGRTVTRDRLASHPVYGQQTLTGAYLMASTSRRAP